MYKDKDKQKEANRRAQARFKAKGITEQGITGQKCDDKVIPSETVTDACGNVHPIDFEARRKVWKLLESWEAGKGTPYQRRLGVLCQQYDVLKGYRKKKTFVITDQGRNYLGLLTERKTA